jgi:hypothetical protein
VAILKWRKLRSGGTPTATVASGGLQRPGGVPTVLVMEREVRSGLNEEKGGARTVLTVV